MIANCLLHKSFFILLLGTWQVFPPVVSGQGSKPAIAPIVLIEPCPPAVARENGGETLASSTPDLLTSKNVDEDTLIKRVNAVGRDCDRGAVEPLIELLGSSSERVRIAVIETFGRLNDPVAIDPLVQIIKTESNLVRMTIARTLLSIRSARARNFALNAIANPSNVLRDEEDLRLRGSVILSLNELNDNATNRKAILCLFSYLLSTDSNMVKIAEEIMSKIPATRNGTRELIGIAKHSNDPEIRIWACTWLGRLSLTAGREVLAETAQKDISPKVRSAAAEALRLIAARGD